MARWYHRTDLDDEMQQFAQNVTDDLNARFGLDLQVLVADDDTNIILDNNENIYLYGCLREAANYTHDGAGSAKYDQEYEKRIRRLNITYKGSEWNTEPPVIKPYTPES